MTNDNDLRKKAMLDQMDGDLPGGMPGSPGNPNTGIGGVPDMSKVAGPSLDPGPIAASPAPAPMGAAPAAPASKPGPFQSGNASVRGYLDEAARAFAPTVQGIKDEAGRKAAVQEYLTSLAPEIQKRGGSISDIRNEKARVDGRMIDFYRDIEGAADPQYLDVTDEGQAPQMGGGFSMPAFGGIPLDGALSGDPLAKIQQAIAQMSGAKPNLDALLAQLGS